MTLAQLKAQRVVTGTVADGQRPLAGANVFILGTIDGALTDSLGHFSFTTGAKGEATLRVTFVGYEELLLKLHVEHMHGLQLTLRQQLVSIDEVVVQASTFRYGKANSMKTMNAVDIALTGNSCGDVVAALQSLPGTQKVGEDGKLYVRGGDSDECQTFINGMHVLVPYESRTDNSAVRGRFSPFLFKGVSFSLGGYGAEYGQALSSVLPMETTDKAENDKLGISASMVDWNVGGTKVLGSSALSFNAALTNMAIYNKVWPDDQDWIRPYGKWSAEAQWKCSLDGATVMKTYAGYDYTTMALRVNGQRVELGEHNSYVNATVKHTAAGGWRLFGGAAWSELRANRHLAEFHLKGTAAKSISAAMKLSAGIESFLRNRYAVAAAFADVQCRLPAHLFAQLSARAEASSLDHRTLLLPRASLTYQPNSQWQLSLMTGSYSQAPADDLLPHMPKPAMQTASHTIVSLQRHFLGTTLRAEAYYKDYRHLPLRWDLALLASNGHGWSKGIDLYAENTSLVNHLATVISYSYNDSRRRYLDYPTADVPQYATRHNVRLTAKYYIEPLKSYIGMTESMASGRPYHDPDRQGYMNARTPVYNSLDISLTVLVSPKVIVYTSLSNVLGRHNIYGYTMPAGSSTLCPVSNPRSRFFYIGLFVSLNNKNAYDISNF